jgi:DNA-binding HxlR family transcriptional regulator
MIAVPGGTTSAPRQNDIQGGVPMAKPASKQNPAVEVEYADEYCPYFHQTIEILGRRWNGVILRTLLCRDHRFNELRAAIPGLSDRLLNERLHELEAGGFVERFVIDEMIRYRLTEQGRAIEPIFNEVRMFAYTWARPDSK